MKLQVLFINSLIAFPPEKPSYVIYKYVSHYQLKCLLYQYFLDYFVKLNSLHCSTSALSNKCSKTVLSNMVATSFMWLLHTLNVASATEELSFKLN